MDQANYRFFKENPDGSVRVDDKNLTLKEFKKLQALMPGAKWAGMMYPRPEVITNYAYVPSVDHATFLENYKADPTKFLTTKKPNTQTNANNNPNRDN